MIAGFNFLLLSAVDEFGAAADSIFQRIKSEPASPAFFNIFYDTRIRK